jgi:hypothetical protein
MLMEYAKHVKTDISYSNIFASHILLDVLNIVEKIVLNVKKVTLYSMENATALKV